MQIVSKQSCRWSLAPAQPLEVSALATALSVSPLLAQCLLNRGLLDSASAGIFLEPRLKLLADPFLLPDMGRAVQRLFDARARGEALVVFGDYDVDGVTSTALLTEVLRRLGWTVHCYLPHRLHEGYGLSQDAVENCLKINPVALLIAIDCGSTSTETIRWLKEQGVDTIVLDHHQLGPSIPAAAALVNPQASDRFHELCAVGLAFKLAHALVKAGRQNGLPGAAEFDLRPLLDLVALGTIADLVPLTGENRILVGAGLERLNTSQRAGLQALRKVARTEGQVGVYEVAFQFAPRLNAAGRLENALQSLNLLLTADNAEAEQLAQGLDAQNRERQQIERKIVDQVIASVRAKFNPDTDYVIVEGETAWHLGVVGIVASRVLREFYRPTVIIGGDGGDWRGSGRSIDGFDLAAALQSCDDLLSRHGGHAMAAGLSMPAANLEAFRVRLNQIAKQTLPAVQLQRPLRLDGEAVLGELTLDELEQLARLQPLGQGNPPVHLLARNLTCKGLHKRMGKDQQHLKMWVTDGAITQEAVWWNCDPHNLPEGRFDLAFAPEINSFNQRRSVQLKVLDWRPA